MESLKGETICIGILKYLTGVERRISCVDGEQKRFAAKEKGQRSTTARPILITWGFESVSLRWQRRDVHARGTGSRWNNGRGEK